MRGLTDDERAALSAGCRAEETEFPDSMRHVVLTLWLQGRADFDGAHGCATEMGKLALRVCPVGES